MSLSPCGNSRDVPVSRQSGQLVLCLWTRSEMSLFPVGRADRTTRGKLQEYQQASVPRRERISIERVRLHWATVLQDRGDRSSGSNQRNCPSPRTKRTLIYARTVRAMEARQIQETMTFLFPSRKCCSSLKLRSL